MKDNAVSSVVSVMLMLTITITLVAVVAVVASGLVSGTNDTISAELTFVGIADDGTIIFQQTAGEPFSTEDLRVIYTMDEYPAFSASPDLEVKSMTPGARMPAGNLTESTGFPTDPGTYYLSYIFSDKRTGNIVSSGIIVRTIESTS